MSQIRRFIPSLTSAASTTRRRMLRLTNLAIALALLLSLVGYPAAALAGPANGSRDGTLASSSLSPAKAYAGKWIDVNLSRQRLTAYVGGRAVYSTLVSTGTAAHPTVTGTFTVRRKLWSQTMSGPGYYLRGVPYVMYFYGGYAIHGTYWHNNFGRRMSHGCVNLPTPAARWLFSWAPMGTRVSVHY